MTESKQGQKNDQAGGPFLEEVKRLAKVYRSGDVRDRGSSAELTKALREAFDLGGFKIRELADAVGLSYQATRRRIKER